MAATRDIKTFHESQVCDVCGRTLLRGERAETWLAGGTRHKVCDLCTARALHEGWIREDSRLELGNRAPVGDRRSSLLGRLRARRPAGGTAEDPAESAPSAQEEAPAAVAPPPPPPPPAAAPEPAPPREPRHVHAVPTRADQRIAAALEAFSQTEHTRTVAGVARSLGAPTVAARPVEGSARVSVVASWELCWYRFTIDLSDDPPAVDKDGQGYELDELDESERLGNASADVHGTLSPSPGLLRTGDSGP